MQNNKLTSCHSRQFKILQKNFLIISLVYIGGTGRSLETKKREHIDAVKIFDLQKSALCQHVAESNDCIDWDNAKILRRESHWHKHRIAAGYLINQKSLELNVLNSIDGLIVPSVYKSLWS